MAELERTNCCGVGELSGLENEAKKTLKDAWEDWFNNPWNDFNGTFIMFSDITRSRSGSSLARYILRHKLGIVSSGKAKRNPNTNNMLKVWVWRVDIPKFKKWGFKNGLIITI